MSTRSSARNLFPPLDNPKLTIRRRSHTDPTLLNDFEIAAEGTGDLLVPDLQTMEELCQPSLNGRGGPIASISIQATNFGLKNDMIQQVQNSCQLHSLSGDDVNKYLDKFLHVTQSIKVNGVTEVALCLYLFSNSLTHRATDWPSDTPVCYLCTCEQCGNILNYGTCLNCNSGIGNSFTYDPIPESFDEVQINPNLPSQCHFDIYLCQICESNSHYGYECLQRVPLVYKPEPCYIQNFSDNDYSHDLLGVNPLIDHHCCYECGNSLNDFFCYQCTCEFCGNGAHITACCDDNDDYNSAITPNEPIDSLSIGNEHLNTILTMKLDEFIKSCVENLVPNPSEFEGENGCDVPACFTTFSNILFDADYESDSKTMLNHDSSIISSSLKIDSLRDEFAGELTLLKSIPPGIDEIDCYPEEDIRLIERLLYDNSSPRPPEEFVFENYNANIESFSPSPILDEDSDSRMEEIDLSFNPDDTMPPGIEEDDYDSERDILILEELLDNYSLSLPIIESYHFDISLFFRPPAKPPYGNTGILNIKTMGDVSDQKVPIPGLTITRVPN
uniref:Reverse transcriptase domain-containing protein n=1 Tax=Tanacetum cinerariifolium TaxID=118510 RepID=A0A6L2J155_TANCI|nr:reverse transcriptase domain-containing protein [Tanacetum cinerariifolium]